MRGRYRLAGGCSPGSWWATGGAQHRGSRCGSTEGDRGTRLGSRLLGCLQACSARRPGRRALQRIEKKCNGLPQMQRRGGKSNEMDQGGGHAV